jgi:hypothetical protein
MYSCDRRLPARCGERADETFTSVFARVFARVRARPAGAITADTEPLGWLTYTENGTCFLNVLVVKFAPWPP